MADEAKILALMNLIGFDRLIRVMLTQNVQMWTNDFGDEHLAEGIADRFDTAEIQRRLVPIYAEVWDAETVDGALDFFLTPAGRRFIGAQEQLLPRVNEVVHAYGLELAARTDTDSN
jgi:hypothetical protein